MKIRNSFRRHSKSIIIQSGLLLVIVIGIFDYLTGPLYSSLVAYLIPVIFVTRFAGRTAGIVISVVGSTIWMLVEILSGPNNSFSPVHFWNLLERLGIFLIVVFILLRLAKMEVEKKYLLALLAHDMKNPALVAKGFSTRLLEGKVGTLTERQMKYVRLINHELSRLERLIMDFLDLSKFENNKIKLSLTQYDLLVNTRKFIEVFGVEAEKKNITLRLELPEERTPHINADATQLDRVFSNLLGNAIKYSSAGGSVTLKIVLQNTHVLVQVQDSGVGIAEEHLQHVFKPFYRISNDQSGSGLGLPIVKSIIAAHGGKIWVESTPGKETTFSFTLPRGHADRDE